MRHLALAGVGHVAVDDGDEEVALVGDDDALGAPRRASRILWR